MRLRVSLLAVLLAVPSLFAGIDLQRVDVLRKQEGDFKRISEYFTGKENTGRRLISRTQDDRRAGIYFTLTLPGGIKQLPARTKVRVEIVTPEKAGTEVFVFNVSDNRPTLGEIWLGLTEPRFANKDLAITAWRVVLLDDKNEILAEKKSYLWGE